MKQRKKSNARKKSEEEEKKKHIKISNGTISEIISHKIVLKLISLTLSKAFTNKVYSKENFDSYYSEYTTRLLRPILQISSIQYDTDDIYINPSTWENIPEPNMITFDRDAFTLINVDVIKANEINEMKESKEGSKGQTPMDATARLSGLNFKKKYSGVSRNIIEQQDKESTISHHSREANSTKEKKFISMRSKGSFDMKVKKDKRQPIIDLPSYNIQNMNLDRDNEEIKRLRKDFEKISIQRREKEMKDEIMRKELKKKANSLLINSITKKRNYVPIKFDLNKFTFDSDGKLIPYKLIPNTNFINEFSEIVSNKKFIKEIVPKAIDDFYTISTKKDEVITNREVSEYTKRTLHKFMRANSSRNLYCQPSGDNFDMITPETGVIVKYDNEKTKIGNMSFFKKYNKYSSNDFSSALNETQSRNKQNVNKTMSDISDMHSYMNEGTSISKIINYSKKKESFNMSHNYHGMTKSMSMSRIVMNSNKSCFDLQDTFRESELPEISSKKVNNLFSGLFTKMFYQRNKDKIKTERDKSRNKSLETINKFTVKLVQHQIKENEKKEKKEILFGKIPIKPNLNEMIRQNGIVIKPKRPLRVNYSVKSTL